jgi:hypothetical protein
MRSALAVSVLILGCESGPGGFRVHIEDPHFVVPGPGLPETVQPQAANNNVSIT